METIYYSPSSILSIFNSLLVVKEEKKIIQVRGIFKKIGKSNYGGFYYNKLKDEASDNSITLITSTLIHNQIDDNKTIEFNGYITRRIDNLGNIQIMINIIELTAQNINKYSDIEIKKIELINKKVKNSYKDIDAVIKKAIYSNKTLNIKIIMGKSGIIDNDIKKAMESSIALYNIEYHRISLSAPSEISNKIKELDNQNTDIICMSRGGGENLEIFENLEICNTLLESYTPIASAIGHADDISLFEKLSDKKFTTPTHFGNYLKEIYNTTIEELQNNKTKIINDAKNEIETQYKKQIENLNQQITATKELSEKTLIESKRNYEEQVKLISDKLKSYEELVKETNKEKELINSKEISNLKTQIEDKTRIYNEQINQINNIQNSKIDNLNQQIKQLLDQQKNKDEMLLQANNIASEYKNQLNSKSNIKNFVVYLLLALIFGIIIGYLFNNMIK